MQPPPSQFGSNSSNQEYQQHDTILTASSYDQPMFVLPRLPLLQEHKIVHLCRCAQVAHVQGAHEADRLADHKVQEIVFHAGDQIDFSSPLCCAELWQLHMCIVHS